MRVVNMAGVDVNVFRFDFDLTFAALLMNADGTIYHTYGGRDCTDPQSHLSLAAFVEVLRRTLPEHQAYQVARKPPKKRRELTIEKIPPMAERIRKGKAPECFHCHMVHEALRDDLRARKKWRRDDLWIWPDPVEAGIRLDKDEQSRVTAVVGNSPGARAGLRPGDRLLTLGGRTVHTFGDVQRVLHEAPSGATTLAATWMRGDANMAGRLKLASGWKEAEPRVFAWRPSKWGLSPRPGFGGPRLKPEELAALGLAADAFAFRIQYLVTWGPYAYTGRNARRAGLRRGDVILSVDGKRDFESVAHFHAWFRLTLSAGTKIPIERIHNGKRKTIHLPVLE